MLLTPPRIALLLLVSAQAVSSACTTDLDCSLNGVCASGSCTCDPAWQGERCSWLAFLPGNASGVGGQPLCVYHGQDANSTSWGGSVLHSPEDGLYWMWVAEMTNHCTLGQWRTNSEVALAKSTTPLGPFIKHTDLVPPWAHNPQAVRAPDTSSSTGFVYALYALGDGVPKSGPPKNCSKGAQQVDKPRTKQQPAGSDKELAQRNITANFTIHYSTQAAGPYQAHVASIVNWPSNWDYGAVGNWNPSPYVHKNGSVYLMAHTSWKAFCGEAIIVADHWRGPYTVVASDTFASWSPEGGSKTTTCGSEDPFLWVDKRGHWHALYHWIAGRSTPGGHSYSVDGIAWSNISGAYNSSRPVQSSSGAHKSVGYGAERPKLLFADDGVTPTHLYNGGSKSKAFTIVSPLRTITNTQ